VEVQQPASGLEVKIKNTLAAGNGDWRGRASLGVGIKASEIELGPIRGNH